MSKAQHDIYRSRVLDLTRTLIVKSSATADAINTELRRLGLTINENDPASWKYYLHLAGEYHSTDRKMTIKSLDTLETIEFNKANLKIHLASAREYREFGSFYRALVAQYPDQEDLIKGIMNPVDLQTAIAAEDGQILYYDTLLVESNEENLIPKLEQWTKIFTRRWLVRAYALVDDLYIAAHVAVMYMLLPSVIMNIRLGNCHTNYAHSYHIREYLASHQQLDSAVDYMTKKQMLWLYREIRYIERNAGKQSTFQSLIQHILTDRGLPLAQWNMRHSLKEMPTEILPNVEFVRESLNLNLSTAGSETRGVLEMLEAESGLTDGNARVIDDVAPIIREQMEYSLNDELETKVLESSILDLTDAAIFTQADTLLYHWLYLSHTNRYTAVLTVDNPRTGAPLVLSAKEAFIVFVYVFGKALGLEMTHLPVLQAMNVRKLQTPLRPVLEGMIDKSLLDPTVMDEIYAAIEPIGTIISTEAFNTAAVKIHQGLMRHRWLWTTRENRDERGSVEAAAMHLYHDFSCDLGQTQTYLGWFTERGLDMPQFSQLEAGLLADSLVSYATGVNLTATTSLRDIQAAMLRIMSTLSSYSVQYLQSINTQPILVTDWPLPRIGHIAGYAKDSMVVNTINVYVQDVRTQGRVVDEIPGSGWTDDIQTHGHADVYDRIEWDLQYNPTGQSTFHYRIDLPRPNNYEWEVTQPQLSDIVNLETDSYIQIAGQPLSEAFDGLISDHYALDSADLATLAARWNARPAEQPYAAFAAGLRYPAPFDANVYLDLFTLPSRDLTVVLDELLYPADDAEVISRGLSYPTMRDSIQVNGVDYPQLQFTFTSTALDYPVLQTQLTTAVLTYPTWVRTVNSRGLVYPQLRDTLTVGALLYPNPPIDVTVNRLEYPSAASDVTGRGLGYPQLNAEVVSMALRYPTTTATLSSNSIRYPDVTMTAQVQQREYPSD